MRQLTKINQSQSVESILIKENEIISDSSIKKWGWAKESREVGFSAKVTMT